MGGKQLAWVKGQLRASKAVWKIIASDMPIGLIVGDGKNFENCANGPGPALGRELEIAELLAYIRREKIHNNLADRGCPLRGVAFLRSGQGNVHRIRAVLGVCEWTAARGVARHRNARPTFGPQVRFTSRPKGARHPAHTRTSSISARWRSMGRQRRQR